MNTTTDLPTIKQQINSLLTSFFDDKVVEATSLSPAYGQLWQSMQRLNQAGGKRLRPYIVMLAYDCFGGEDSQAILPVAAAWELLHLCMLMHDDIIDNDSMRYGVKNVAGDYFARYRARVRHDGRAQHFAEGAAMLGGDLLLSAAYELVSKAVLPAEQRLQASQNLAEATFMVAGGELLDMESVMQSMQTVDTMQIAFAKTASYSFVMPLVCGAQLAGASQTDLEKLRQYGLHTGYAFQLVDDLLGIFGDPSQTGKSNSGDIAEGKRTFLMQRTFERATPDQLERLQRLVGAEHINEAQAEQVREIIVQAGAVDATRAEINRAVEAAETSLARLSISGECQAELHQLLQIATERLR